jgi:hypothetical protein
MKIGMFLSIGGAGGGGGVHHAFLSLNVFHPKGWRESRGNKNVNVEQLLFVIKKEILYVMKAKPSSLKLP